MCVLSCFLHQFRFQKSFSVFQAQVFLTLLTDVSHTDLNADVTAPTETHSSEWESGLRPYMCVFLCVFLPLSVLDHLGQQFGGGRSFHQFVPVFL